jgi:hypothetical protein
MSISNDKIAPRLLSRWQSVIKKNVRGHQRAVALNDWERLIELRQLKSLDTKEAKRRFCRMVDICLKVILPKCRKAA